MGKNNTWWCFLGLAILMAPFSLAAEEADGKFHALLPGIEAQPLPLDLPNCNNVLYRHDGKLVVLSYEGDVYLLSDTDGDGAEDEMTMFFENKGRFAGQIGMDVAPKDSPHGNAVFVAMKGAIVMLADRDGDDRAETIEILAEGWPPARAGVDVTGLTLDPRDGSVWYGLGVRRYNDAYELEETGTAQNDLSSVRGAIHRISPDFKSQEKICTGIRWAIALRFNRHGDLFCTDQEGATWLPNGNPFDELLHVEKGRHYGFPPRHPRHLPDVIDEPSVYDYGPQHQSTCGMNFNEPVNGGPVFGPTWWAGDAIVVGESRGKLYRTKLVKTAAGYVAHNEIFACLGLLVIDACVSPKGELRVCTHSGPPDWGTGPKGKGKIWRVTYDSSKEVLPQPVLTWRETAEAVHVAFDRPLPEAWAPGEVRIEASVNARAGDRFETMRPGYEVVKRQQSEGRQPVSVLGSAISEDRRRLSLKMEPLADDTWLSVDLDDDYALQASTNGLTTRWTGEAGETWSGWLPHADLFVSRALTGQSAHHDRLWEDLSKPGELQLEAQLDLWHMLRPDIQKGAQLDYEYPPETVTVTFTSTSGPLSLALAGKEPLDSTLGQVTHDVSFTVTPESNKPFPLTLRLKHPGGSPPQLSVYWSTQEDPRHRTLPLRRFIMPWATTAVDSSEAVAARPELAGGNWAKGRALYFGNKAQCSLCHQWNGEGIHIGPDLTNLPHRDYASVLRDIRQPSATLNPDYSSFQIQLARVGDITAVRRDEADGTVYLAVGPGASFAVRKEAILKAEPVATSLMPEGIEAHLTETELRDLMTFLLIEPPVMRDYASLPRDGVDHAPKPRTREEIDAILAGVPEPAEPARPLKLVLIAGPKDHGFGEHDYPRWQRVWSRLLSLAKNTDIGIAWRWPTPVQWEEADVLVFFKRGDWTVERSNELRAFLERGGGAVFIHWACEGGDDALSLARQIGLASNREYTRYRHGLVDVVFENESAHPILRGFDRTRFHDESYWELVGNVNEIVSLGTCQEEGETRPLFWSREIESALGERNGRVFVSIPGHYSWTFDDPLFRILLLRGIAWSAHEPVDRFNHLVEAGITVSEEEQP